MQQQATATRVLAGSKTRIGSAKQLLTTTFGGNNNIFQLRDGLSFIASGTLISGATFDKTCGKERLQYGSDCASSRRFTTALKVV